MRPGTSLRNISSEMRVPEPGSRMRKCSSAIRSLDISRTEASLWSGGAMMTSG